MTLLGFCCWCRSLFASAAAAATRMGLLFCFVLCVGEGIISWNARRLDRATKRYHSDNKGVGNLLCYCQ